MTDASQVPPGWYDDPEDPRSKRWWNGLAWTDDRQPAAEPVFTAPAAPAYAAYPSYPSAPAATTPELRRDIATNTVWIWVVVLLPLLSLVPLFFVDWAGYIEGTVRDSMQSPSTAWMSSFTGFSLVLTLVGWVLVAVQIVAAYLDWRALRARGIQRPFHWAWIFFTLVISNGVYVIGRGVVLRRQTGSGLGPVWAWIAVTVVTIAVGIGFAVYILNIVFALIPTIEQYTRS
ncbi:DUF2510 domain-containing protein [Microbacterium sp. RD1]|uniref:DUF2510 domain-containing protein n=1 Tax=Microbacterium sp. RD1 TaxID=3457313 RepID=UPI003FA59EB6